jgi:FkbM family methyltransferase
MTVVQFNNKEEMIKQMVNEVQTLESDKKNTSVGYNLNAAMYYEFAGFRYLVYPEVKPQDVKMTEIMLDFVMHGKSGYEPETTKIVKNLVKEGDVCIDVGASIGYFSLLFAKLVGETGQVISIEPVRMQHKYFISNVEANGLQNRIKLYDCAAWDKEEEKEMFSAALLKGTGTKVKCIPLDTILDKLPKVDFIKMDVDGSEPQALKGLEKTIAKNPQLQLIIEYYPKYLELAGNNPDELMAYLKDKFTIEEVIGDLGGGCINYLCKRK